MADRSIARKFFDRVAEHPDRLLFQNKESGAWRKYSWAMAGEIIREIGQGLLALGVEPGERVAILSENRLEWVFTDLAILAAGGVSVGIYPSVLAAEVEYIVGNSEARVIFVSNAGQLQKLADRAETMPTLEQIITYARIPGAPAAAITLEELRARGRADAEAHPDALAERTASLDREDLALLIYTSGTTGPPKGVMLSHGNILWVYEAMARALDINDTDQNLSYLPYAHVYERIGGIYFSIFRGLPIAIAEGLDKLTQNIAEIRPTILLGAPRVYEKIHAGLMRNVEAMPAWQKFLFHWAMKVGEAASPYKLSGEPMPLGLKLKNALAGALIFNKIKDRFGGRIRFMVSAAAPIAPELIRFFHALDILILEGYGLSESSAPSHVNRPGEIKFGTVGRPLPGVEQKIAEDGEILLRGGNIFKGYFKREEDTREALDAEGWFHTGDIGEIDADGYLKITDRKKDLIITAGGKNIGPQNIENLMKTDRFISEFLCYGDQKKFLVGLVTLEEESIRQWAQSRGLAFQDFAELSQKPEVKQLLEGRIAELNKQLPSYSTVKRIIILPKQFTQDEGEVTPTLKLKRKVLNRKYRDPLEALYAGVDDGAI